MKLRFSDMFKGDDGTLSFSRVIAGVVVAFTLIWCTYTVYTNKTIPDLLGIAALLTATYGANRVSEAIVQKSVNENAVPPPKADVPKGRKGS